MTNFIKLNIEEEIKNNEGELQGFKWEEVYVNADNISHFKKVKIGYAQKCKTYFLLIRNIRRILILAI